MALRDLDQIIVNHKQSDDPFKQDFQTVKTSFADFKDQIAPLAKPAAPIGGLLSPGTPGLMWPSTGLKYNARTGELQTEVTSAMRLVGLLEKDFEKPKRAPDIGDMYLAIENVELNNRDWPGISGEAYITAIKIVSGGNNLRPSTGYWSGFGSPADSSYSALPVVTGDTGLNQELVLGVNVDKGRVKDVVVANPGQGYAVGAIVQLSAIGLTTVATNAYVRILTTDSDGGVLTVEKCQADGTTEILGRPLEYVGSGYYCPPGTDGVLDDAQTASMKDLTGDYGTGLRVRVPIVGGVAVAPITQTASSNPVSYEDAEQVRIIDPTTGLSSDALLMIELVDATDTFHMRINDKIIYVEGATGSVWAVIRDFVAEQAIFDLLPAPGADVAVPFVSGRGAGDEFNTLYFDIKLADPTGPYNGLMSGDDKVKLDTIKDGSEPGTVVDILTVADNNYYTGAEYAVIDIVDTLLNDPTDASKNVTLTLNKAKTGELGVVSVVDDGDASSRMVEHHSVGIDVQPYGTESVLNYMQSIRLLAPQNFSVLPKHPKAP